MSHLYHWLGLDGGVYYNVLSGVLPDLAFIAAIATWYRKHNCHEYGCPRIGRHAIDGTEHVVCRHHHPDGAPSNLRSL